MKAMPWRRPPERRRRSRRGTRPPSLGTPRWTRSTARCTADRMDPRLRPAPRCFPRPKPPRHPSPSSPLASIRAIRVEYGRHEAQVLNSCFWCGVGVTHNTFGVESFVAELAAAAKADPFEYRRALLDKSPRARAVLELAAQRAGWGANLPAGRGRGIALMFGGLWGTYVAQVAEVSVSQSGEVRVHRVGCAVDCGTIVNPR